MNFWDVKFNDVHMQNADAHVCLIRSFLHVLYNLLNIYI